VVSTTDLLSYLCAALAAFGNALANVAQRKASLQAPADTEFGWGLLRFLAHNSTWLIGISGMVASFILQAVALGFGELSAVEPIITLEVPLTLLVASRVFKTKIGRQEWVSILVMTVSMIALIGALDPRPGNETNVDHVTYVLAGGATAGTVVALVLLSRALPPVRKTACLGAAAGTAFGLTATLIKETVTQLTDHGLLGVVTTWQTYAAIGFGLLGVLIMQWALHSGPLLAAQPGFTLADPLVSILWGVLVYNEVTRTGPWLVLASAGGIGIGVGVALLARSPLFDPESAEGQTEIEGSPAATQLSS
jgi:drug/metabolite transporter (DMT)-like permease